MTRIPRDPLPGEDVSATMFRQLLRYLRESRLVQGDGIMLSRGPHGTVVNSTSVSTVTSGTANIAPFTVRYHDPTDGQAQWEIWLPPGCVACGGTCVPLNKQAKTVNGHDKDNENWYVFALDEGQGNAQTDDGGRYKKFDVVVHAKTSAKVQGEDGMDSDARRLVYVNAWIQRNFTGNDEAERMKAYAGDEFSQVVAVVTIREKDGKKTRVSTPTVTTAISVAGRSRGNFDLVWWFKRQNDDVQFDKVYCVRNTISVVGMTVKGDDMTDVSAAVADSTEYHRIYALIKPVLPSNENFIEVHVDPDVTPNQSDDYNTWLWLYDLSCNGGKCIDYRGTSLANVQIWRG